MYNFDSTFRYFSELCYRITNQLQFGKAVSNYAEIKIDVAANSYSFFKQSSCKKYSLLNIEITELNNTSFSIKNSLRKKFKFMLLRCTFDIV